MKRKQIISLHPYSIWQNDAGLWCTHIRDITGKKKIRRRKTKEELLDFIVHHYRELEEKVYLIDIFEEWSNKKLSYGEISKQSYDKYCSEFKLFFTPDKKICKKQVKYITELDLEDFTHFMGDLELPRNIFSKQYNPKELEVFSEEEIPLVTNYLKDHPDIWNLALLFRASPKTRMNKGYRQF